MVKTLYCAKSCCYCRPSRYNSLLALYWTSGRTVVAFRRRYHHCLTRSWPGQWQSSLVLWSFFLLLFPPRVLITFIRVILLLFLPRNKQNVTIAEILPFCALEGFSRTSPQWNDQKSGSPDYHCNQVDFRSECLPSFSSTNKTLSRRTTRSGWCWERCSLLWSVILLFSRFSQLKQGKTRWRLPNTPSKVVVRYYYARVLLSLLFLLLCYYAKLRWSCTLNWLSLYCTHDDPQRQRHDNSN